MWVINQALQIYKHSGAVLHVAYQTCIDHMSRIDSTICLLCLSRLSRIVLLLSQIPQER